MGVCQDMTPTVPVDAAVERCTGLIVISTHPHP
jgi:hypothetical protein